MRQSGPASQDVLRPKAGGCACGGSCPRCQAKSNLTIGEPDDQYEREADAVADRVMRMTEPQVQRQAEPEDEGEKEEELVQTKPSNGAPPLVQRQMVDADEEEEEEEEQEQEQEEETLQAKPHLGNHAPLIQRQVEPDEEQETHQAKEASGRRPAVSSQLESRIRAQKSGGQPLAPSIRAFFEPRFGYDFRPVRVHVDSRAAETAQALNARAFTVGHDIVFGNGQYQPTTVPGRQLLAHELSHTVQQGAVPRRSRRAGSDRPAQIPAHSAPPAAQRKMKFEFQTRNALWRRRGKTARLLAETTRPSMRGRKFGPKDYLRKGGSKKGTELQTDTGGVIEFETDGWFKKWSKLKAHIEEAVDMVKDIVDTKNLIDPKTLPEDQRSNPRYRWPWKKHQKAAQLNKKTKGWMDSLRKGETLEVEVKDKMWFAAIQSSEEIELSQYESLLREHEWRSSGEDRYIEPTITSAQEILNKANKKGIPADELVNLRSLLQIIVNYIKRGRNVEASWGGYSKATYWLMSRTSFSSMYESSLLSKPEKELFQQIVKDKLILRELKLDEKTKVFKAGAIKTKARHVTVQEWLESIINPRAFIMKKGERIWLRDKQGRRVRRDLLSHGLFGLSHAMGALDVDPEKRTVRFEVRGTRSPREGVKRHKFPSGTWRAMRDQPLEHWVDYAESLFAEAFKCRGTRLDYDQTDKTRKKKFTPPKCP